MGRTHRPDTNRRTGHEPHDRDASLRVAAPAAELPDPVGSETILLPDDNPPPREVTHRHLVAPGYQVRPAASGAAALAMLKSGESFDLVITAVAMPDGLSGDDLAGAARPMQPALMLLFAIVHARDLSVEGEAAAGAAQAVSAPGSCHGCAVGVGRRLGLGCG